MTLPDIEAVGDIIREVAATEIMPRFRTLAAGDIREKAPGDLVTIADEASERALTRRLTALLPGSEVVGEEACALDPTILDRLSSCKAPVWIIDPVDGTHNFAHGKPVFAVLVALSIGDQAVAGWTYDPVTDQMMVAEQGAGAWIAGQRLRAAPGGALPSLCGSMSTKFFESEERKRLEGLRRHFAGTYRLFCAGHEYLHLLTGIGQFAMYNRCMPWDHAAGTLAYQEAGGHVANWDGTPYKPSDVAGGILMAGDAQTWVALNQLLFGAKGGGG